MASLFNQGSRPLATPAVAATPQNAGRPAAAPTAPASGKAAPALPVVESVPDRLDSVRLSAQALATRAASGAGKTTLDVAKTFTQRFASALFGDDAKGASLNFDSITLDTSASFSAAGSVNAGAATASLSYSESAHFVGTGQLTLDDGRVFDIEVEVQYEANVQAAAQERHEPSPDVALTGKQLPPIKYPGGIEDLFKLLGRELSTEQGDPGKLTLRLMRLVDRAALLAPRLQEEDAPAAAAARQSAANAYALAKAVEG
jgi:hypothetical protein